MRIRKQCLGQKNLIGARVQRIRREQGMKQKDLLVQLQINGVDMNSSALSKLEGQIRSVSDIELVAISKILGVTMEYLVEKK